MKSTQTDNYNVMKVRDELARSQPMFARLGFSVALLKLGNGTVVSQEGLISIEGFFKNLGAATVDAEYFANHFANLSSALSYLTFNVDNPGNPQENKLVVAKKYVSFTDANAIELYILDKKQLLSQDSSSSEAIAILKPDQIVTIEASKNAAIIEKLLSAQMRQRIISNENSGLTDGDYEYVMKKSSVIDWYYVCLTSKSFFIKSLQQLLIRVGFLCISLLLLGYWIILRMSKYLYKPVQNILGHLGQFEPFKEKDEFVYIQNTLVNIHETNRELLDTIQKNKLPQKDRFLKGLLHGLLSGDEIHEQIENNGLELLKEAVRIVIIQIDEYDKFEDELQNNALVMIDSIISNHINAHLQNNIQYVFLEMSKNQFVFVTKDGDRQKLTALINHIIADIETHISISLIAVIGETCESTEDIPDNFQKTLNVLDKRFAIDEKKVILADSIKAYDHDSYYYPINLEHDLIHNLIRGNVLEADIITQRIVQGNLVKRTLSLETNAQLIFALSATINRVMEITNKSIEYFFHEGTRIYLELRMCENKKQLEEKIVYIFHTMATAFKKQSDNLENSVIKSIDSYIVNNYHTDFSLVDLAEHLGFSVAYTSTLFKNVTGENFKDYLNIYRIKKAKEILQKENIKINELAARVGYNNANSFIRMFKRYETISPGQYIKDLEKRDSP
jgi:AraC-like DNA-binding protein